MYLNLKQYVVISSVVERSPQEWYNIFMIYKLLLLDVDGTLIKSKDAVVSPAVVKAISQIKDNIHVSLCTGRTRKDAQTVIDSLGINFSYHIIESGAKVLSPTGKEENVKDITLDEIKWIMGQVKNTPAAYGYCVNGIWVENIDDIGSGQVTTLSLHSHTKVQTQAIIKTLDKVSQKFHIGVGSHWQIKDGSFILITNKLASKKSAIEYVQQKLGITKVETMGIGDMLNDLPLFEASGFKVAMGNGDQALKDKADYIAASIDDDGVAEAITKFIIST